MSSAKHVTLDLTKLDFKFDSKLKGYLIAMILIGIASLAIAFTAFGHVESRHLDVITAKPHHSNMGYNALLVATWFVIGISITGIFFTGVNHLTGAYWSVGVRRITEAYGLFAPVAGLLLIGVAFGLHDLYEWSHEGVPEHDELIGHKAGFLNAKFFYIRLALFVTIWSVFGYLFYTLSKGQDSSKKPETTKTLAKLGGAFTILFALSFCFSAFDLIMSLTPHWYSTMFGVYQFAGAFQTGLVSYAIVILILKSRGYYGDAINENHWHDIGKFLLGMTVFWAYTGFSQFMLIWYAAIPEETFFYEQRLNGGWTFLTIALPIAKFIVPFLLLLNRPNKRDLKFLVGVGLWIVLWQFLEIYWHVFPANYENFSFAGLLLSLGATIGTIGLFGFFVFSVLEKQKLIPVGDPRLEGSLSHHQ